MEVPISLMYRKDLIRFGGAGSPLLLEGYGAYGIAIDPFFDADRLSILDRSVTRPCCRRSGLETRVG